MKQHNYFVYITSNPTKTVFYVGMTNDLSRRLIEHRENRGKPETFAGRYYCYKLLYYERFTYVQHAIEREKELKLMIREEKITLIKSLNPKMLFLKIAD
ncbi:GIY-YIG nuclease family protein [Rufibacter glacialis]|uniref:GIY-YIG nuclease family protein n=1 Tax=Rufibacter glacialis TaxID=1259555 RepID=A0A5M8Q5G5_9BACT|nr:GIY-YIG nuclease family protein [Rufibacter glacialis]KAA6431137.1 GIY-YIG nuclease family protein [Rufibacter glacialis]GGK84312.1 endonuclease [Rufibacter glacialis]